MVLQRPDEPHQRHKEEEDPHANDHSHHPEAGDQAEPFAPGGNANHQQAHHLWRGRGEQSMLIG